MKKRQRKKQAKKLLISNMAISIEYHRNWLIHKLRQDTYDKAFEGEKGYDVTINTITTPQNNL